MTEFDNTIDTKVSHVIDAKVGDAIDSEHDVVGARLDSTIDMELGSAIGAKASDATSVRVGDAIDAEASDAVGAEFGTAIDEKADGAIGAIADSAIGAEHDDVTAEAPEEPKRYTYLDCLRGAAPVPTHVNGATIFQVLMVGGMVTFMVTINGLRNTGLDFLVNSHWLYPLMFCLAFLVRTFYGAPLVNKLAPELVFKRFEGPARGVAMTVLNVCCMAPIMCAIATLLIVGTDDFLVRYLTTLPIVAPMAMLVNFFIVGPIAKLLFLNKISPSGGLGLLGNLEQNTPNLARLLGC